MPGAYSQFKIMTRRFLLAQFAAAGAVFPQIVRGLGDPLENLNRSHPRLIVLDSDLQRIHALVHDVPLARKLHESLLRDAEKLQTAPPSEYKLNGPRLIAQSRRVLDRVYLLALLYRLESRPEFLERALKELRAAALFPDWNPSHFLDVAEMTHAFAIGYDWLYPALSQADRDWIRGTLAVKGLDPAIAQYKGNASWVAANHNWNLVCNSGAGIGALAVAAEEPDRARTILRSALESLPRALVTYGTDGGWPEGPAYWNYATRYIVSFIASLESATGTDEGLASSRGFERTGRFRVYFIGPSNKTFNFGDAADDPGTAPEMFWLARRFNQPVYAWAEQRDADHEPHADPLDLVWFDKDARTPHTEDWPLDALFTGIQTAFLRSAWDDPNALFAGVKGGDNKANHTHLDLGSFVFDAGGMRWAYDPGPEDYNEPGYFGPKRFTYFKTSTGSHNTVLIDGENQDQHAEARLTLHETDPDLRWVEIELSKTYPATLKQWTRRVGIAQKQALLIQDSILAIQPVDALWGMMTDADITYSGQTAELRKGDWSLSCEILSPHHAVFDVVTESGTKKLVVRAGPKIPELELNVLLTPHRTGQPKAVVTKRFPA